MGSLLRKPYNVENNSDSVSRVCEYFTELILRGRATALFFVGLCAAAHRPKFYYNTPGDILSIGNLHKYFFDLILIFVHYYQLTFTADRVIMYSESEVMLMKIIPIVIKHKPKTEVNLDELNKKLLEKKSKNA